MSGFERLAAADPAAGPDEVSMARLRRRVMRTRRPNPMSIAAAVTAFAMVAGAGVAVGRITAPDNTNTAAVEFGTPTPSFGKDAAVPGRTAFGTDGATSSYAWWGGRVILNPTSSIGDEGGRAAAFTFTSIEGVDKRAVLQGFADLIGATGSIVSEGRNEDVMTIGNNMEGKPSATINQDPMLSFYAYNNDRSPWNCVRQQDIDSSTKEGAYPPDVRICNDEDLKPASKAVAEQALAKALAILGLRSSDVATSFTDTGSDQVVMIQGNAKVAGTETNMQRIAISVSARGVFNISGFAAKAVEVEGYEIVGARTAALRSQLTKWSALGPNPFGEWGVYPMEGQAMAPRTFSVDGRPGIFGNVDTVAVSKARLGLVSYWMENTTMLLPSWIFTASDGRQWSMIALADKYVQF